MHQNVHQKRLFGIRWVSLIGSTDGPPREVVLAIEPELEIVEVRCAEFRSHVAKAWFCIARRRI